MPVHLPPRLRRPDAPAWLGHPDYSWEAAAMLRTAFARLESPNTPANEYLWACMDVARWHDAKIAPNQQVRTSLLFARAHEADHEYSDAVRYVDRALEIASEGRGLDEYPDLLVYHAKLQRALLHYDVAFQDIRDSLVLRTAHVHGDPTRIEPNLRLELLALQANYALQSAQFECAEQLVTQAIKLIPLAPKSPLTVGDVIWVRARLNWCRGLNSQALEDALHVDTIYSKYAPPDSYGRLQSVIAQIYLDLADELPIDAAGTKKTFYLREALHAMVKAEKLARQWNDPPGSTIAQLTRLSWDRLSGHSSDRIGTLDGIIYEVRRHDDALLAQALISRGDELAACGEPELAGNLYRQTIAALDGGGMAYFMYVAYRRLMRLRALHPNHGFN
jgi:hypothetical protein